MKVHAEEFDVFMSYTSADANVVVKMAKSLGERGLRPWIDVEQISPGQPFQERIEYGLLTSRSAAIFVGTKSVDGWVSEELRVAISRSVKDKSFRVFLVLLPAISADFDPTELPLMLMERTWVDLRYVDDLMESTDLLARAVRGEPLPHPRGPSGPATDTCPYVGLRPFTEAESSLFFGREADIQRMLEKLRRTPFLSVLGRSGSGKSSAVRAGLLPRLRAGALPGSEGWQIRVLRPSARPLDVLAAEIVSMMPELGAKEVREELASGDLSLLHLTEECSSGPVVWVIDQAEELFTLCEDQAARQMFAGHLLTVSQGAGKDYVLLVVRSDFYHHFSTLNGFGPRMASHQYMVSELKEEALPEVIRGPAAEVGLTVSDRLVKQILDDVRDQGATLPLLQHALRELWGVREGTALTLKGYEEIGGVSGSLVQHADTVLEEIVDRVDLDTARRLLLAMVRLGTDGAEDTKQPRLLAEIVGPAYPLDRLHRVATVLADARLITLDTDRAGDDPDVTNDEIRLELAHEALITSWPTLRLWVNENRDELSAHRRIQAAASIWEGGNRSTDLLYRGAALAQAEAQSEAVVALRGNLETDFVAASRNEVGRRQRKRTQLLVAGASVLTALTVVAVVGAILAILASQSASESAVRNQAQQARALGDQNPPLAVALSAEALAKLTDSEIATVMQESLLAYGLMPAHRTATLSGHDRQVQSVDFGPEPLLATVSSDGTGVIWDYEVGAERFRLEGHAGPLVGVGFNDDGSLLATAGTDRSVKLWDPQSGLELRTIPTGPGILRDLTLSHDGKLLATAGIDGVVKIFDPRTGDELRSIPAHRGQARSISFDSEGQVLASVGDDGELKLWDVDTGNETISSSGHTGEVVSVAFSPDDDQVATGGSDGTARLWDPVSGIELGRLTTHSGTVWDVSYSPDGTMLATASGDGTAKLWDTSSLSELATMDGHDPTTGLLGIGFSRDGRAVATAGEDSKTLLWDLSPGIQVVTLDGHADWVQGVSFDGDGRRIVTGSGDRTAKVWEPGTGIEIAALLGHEASIFGVAFGPDGSIVATGSRDHAIKLWQPSGDELDTLEGHSDWVWSVAFDPAGSSLVSASADGTAVVWTVSEGNRRITLGGHEGQVFSAAFSPDGSMVATGSEDNTARLWDTESGIELMKLEGHDDFVHWVAFSPDGELLATASADRTAKLWDLSTGQEIASFVGHTDAVRAIAFSPDGSVLATGSEDRTAKLWDPETTNEIATLGGHAGSVWGMAFSPDGKWLATASSDRQVIIRELILTPEEACEIVRKEVTQAELLEAMSGSPAETCTNLS